MKPIACSAPGKLFLGGEYAVLKGAEAVVTAVGRRAVAFPGGSDEKDSCLVASVREHVTRHLENTQTSFGGLSPVSATSSGFTVDHHKVGLGSSAAVAAAVTGLLFELAGAPVSQRREDILGVATDAHRAAQGGKGSGADVAAAVHGGTIVFSMSGAVEPLSLGGIRIVTVWSGRSASTSEMIGKIWAFEKERPKAHQACFEGLSAGAADFAEACRRGTPRDIIDAAATYGKLMDALGRVSGVPVITKSLRRIMNLAGSHGGAAKPSGAGGGDIAVAFFAEDEAVGSFRRECIRQELRPLDLEVDAPGLRRETEIPRTG
jgi:phosphomevalonate kinase